MTREAVSGVSLLDALRRIGPDGTAAALAAVPSLRDELIEEHGRMRAETVYSAKRDTIIEMAEDGCSDREIADRLGCSSSNVAQRRRQMGIPAGGVSKRWTDAEEEHLRQMVAMGFTLDEMAAELGRSTCAVEYRRKKIHANLRCTPRRWSEHDDAILAAHWEAGTPICLLYTSPSTCPPPQCVEQLALRRLGFDPSPRHLRYCLVRLATRRR